MALKSESDSVPGSDLTLSLALTLVPALTLTLALTLAPSLTRRVTGWR